MKGGITSAVVLRRGLGAKAASVIGPVAAGASLWRAHGADGEVPCVVVPGNVGGASLLADLVSAVTSGASAAC